MAYIGIRRSIFFLNEWGPENRHIHKRFPDSSHPGGCSHDLQDYVLTTCANKICVIAIHILLFWYKWYLHMWLMNDHIVSMRLTGDTLGNPNPPVSGRGTGAPGKRHPKCYFYTAILILWQYILLGPRNPNGGGGGEGEQTFSDLRGVSQREWSAKNELAWGGIMYSLMMRNISCNECKTYHYCACAC